MGAAMSVGNSTSAVGALAEGAAEEAAAAAAATGFRNISKRSIF